MVDTPSPKVSPRKRQVPLDEDDPIEESVQSTSIAPGSSNPHLFSWEQTNAPSSSASGNDGRRRHFYQTAPPKKKQMTLDGTVAVERRGAWGSPPGRYLNPEKFKSRPLKQTALRFDL